MQRQNELRKKKLRGNSVEKEAKKEIKLARRLHV